MAAAMPQMAIPPAASRLLLSGNEAVARAVWESGVRVAAAYPGTPSTEMLEVISGYPDIYAEWSVNEKVSLEVAIGAAFAGSRSFCAMKHVGMNVASDALMTLTLTGVVGGLVIAIADDVGLSSSQNEQDSRYWGRFAHLPMFEPSDSQEVLRDDASAGLRFLREIRGAGDPAHDDPHLPRQGSWSASASARRTSPPASSRIRQRWVMVPGRRQAARGADVRARGGAARRNRESSPLNPSKTATAGRLRHLRPAYMHVRETFPDAPVLKLGQSCPLPLERRASSPPRWTSSWWSRRPSRWSRLELRAAGIACAWARTCCRASANWRPTACARHRPPARRAGAGHAFRTHRRSFRARRPCAWPVPTSASITRWRRCKQHHHRRRHRLLHPGRRPSLERAGHHASRWAPRWA
jgi:indolepyruvate ferredoxin oxidoreductase alpha subunit